MVGSKFQALIEFAHARLSRRIVSWVFLSIVVIELIILIPSVYRRERELLNYLTALASAQATGLLDVGTMTDLQETRLLNYLSRLQRNPVVLGGALYDQQGHLIGTFGEPPQLSLVQARQRWGHDQYFRWQQRYDAPWIMPALQDQYVLIIRHDASWVQREFFAFIARIVGLVLIISVFVTGATLFGLKKILITPILQLRQDLLKAGQAIRDDFDTRQLAFASLTTVRHDELGDVISAFDQMFSQITEAVATRKQSETRFRTLVEQAVDAFFVVNRQADIIDVNQSACDSLGYQREELLQMQVADIQTNFNWDDFDRLWPQLRPGMPQSREAWHQRKDGSGFPVEVRMGLLTIGQEPLILALVRDISERKTAETAMARLAEIGELAAMIVHEVRSPLTTVLMGLNAFEQLDLSERDQIRLNLALEESQRLQKLLNEILLYARQDALERQTLDLNRLIQTLADHLLTVPVTHQKSLVVNLLDYPVYIRGDGDKLKQVFINLISNACEAIAPGHQVIWQLHHPSPDRVTVTVHNGGEPIPSDILPKLTQPFFTTKKTGNGLGLAITHRIVEAHGGYLTITSSAGAGTLVTVDLPLAPKPGL